MYVGAVGDFLYKNQNWLKTQPKFCLKESSHINYIKINKKFYRLNLYTGELVLLTPEFFRTTMTYGKKIKSKEKSNKLPDLINESGNILKSSLNDKSVNLINHKNCLTENNEAIKTKLNDTSYNNLIRINKTKNDKQGTNKTHSKNKSILYRNSIFNKFEQKTQFNGYNTNRTEYGNANNKKIYITNNFDIDKKNEKDKKIINLKKKPLLNDKEDELKIESELAINDNDNTITKKFKDSFFKKYLFNKLYNQYNFYKDDIFKHRKTKSFNICKMFKNNGNSYRDYLNSTIKKEPYYKRIFFQYINREKKDSY